MQITKDDIFTFDLDILRSIPDMEFTSGMISVLNPELTGPFSKLIQQYSNVMLGALILYAALLRIAYKYAHTDRFTYI